MPYINKHARLMIQTLHKNPGTSGELNFQLTETILAYINEKGLDYQIINDILGALEGCKLEFVRRVVNKYEDEKIKENGDLYE